LIDDRWVPNSRLVHLNGPPGIGKSTLARRYIADHPLSFCLDIDGIRRLIGGWDAHGQESGRLARRMALRMMQEHLGAGHDVVVPQYVARPEAERRNRSSECSFRGSRERFDVA